MVKHALASSAYRDRVAECAAAVTGIRQRFPGVESLRDASPEQLETVASQLPELALWRARHVISEDARVGQFVEASAAGDPRRMGQLMLESHASLRDDYQVSCVELDFLVEAAMKIAGVYGARMTGGGFGGCTVTLLSADAVDSFQAQISSAYRDRFGVTPSVYTCRPSEGAREV
jgi:galactokinase